MALFPSSANLDTFLYSQFALYIALYAYHTQYSKQSKSSSTTARVFTPQPAASPSPSPSPDDEDTALDRSISALQREEQQLYDPLSTLLGSPHIQAALHVLNVAAQYAQLLRQLLDDIALFLFTFVCFSLFTGSAHHTAIELDTAL